MNQSNKISMEKSSPFHELSENQSSKSEFYFTLPGLGVFIVFERIHGNTKNTLLADTYTFSVFCFKLSKQGVSCPPEVT